MMLFLERIRSNVFENGQAHSLIAVFVSRVYENGGVVKSIDLSGSVIRRLASRIECFKGREGI